MSQWFRGGLLGVLSVLALAGCGEGSLPVNDEEVAVGEAEEAVVDCSVVWEKELMITDMGVIGDARARNNGPWSFGGLMKALAGTRDEQRFIKGFVESWMQDQTLTESS